MSFMPIHSFLRAGVTGILFFIGAVAGLTQTITPDGIAILWPANAVLLTALLMTSRDEWPVITTAALIAASAASFFASFPVWSVALFGLVNIFECLLAAVLIRWFAGKEFEFQSFKGMVVFFLAAPVIACSVAAILGASIYEALARTDNPLVVLWRLWWFGDAVGMIIFTPLLVSVWNSKLFKNKVITRQRMMSLAELVLIWGGIALTGVFAFHTAREGDLSFFLSPLLLLGFAIWVAVRLEMLATTATVAVIAGLVIALLVQPEPFFTVTVSPQDAVWLAQEFLVAISIIAVGLSGLMQKFRRQRAALKLQDRAMEACNDAISIVDVQQAGMPVIWVNPKFEELFGYRAEEIVDRSWGLLQEGIREQYGLEVVSEALASKKACLAELEIDSKEGERLWVSFSLAPVSDRHGQVTHYVATHHDRTEARKTEDRLRDTTERLQRNNELLEEKVQERTASLQKANEELEQVASVDFLTGISNRRHFYELGQRELSRLRLDGSTAALIAFDLDNFKAINDTFGHEAGDEVLQQVVIPVEQSIRPTDSFGRVGGDEFLILFTNTSVSKAVEVAERIRTEITRILSASGSARLGVTASFGVAGWDQHSDLRGLIRLADRALYRAKEEGRNNVCTWDPERDREADDSELSGTG